MLLRAGNLLSNLKCRMTVVRYLVKYVVPGALPPTMHSGDAALMRFGAFT
jgi:hypothetical protein